MWDQVPEWVKNTLYVFGLIWLFSFLSYYAFSFIDKLFNRGQK